MAERVAAREIPERLVLREGSADVAHLVLNRPGQRNALSLAMLEALEAAIREVAEDRAVRAIVLAARGTAFSAGHDLRELAAIDPDDARALFDACSRVMRLLHDTPQPVVARVHGIATAAGCQLVAACDLAVAAESATFATPGVRIGLFCSTPAVPLVRAVGRKRALEMLFTGAAVDARTALEWGLVNRVVPEAELDAAVVDLLAPILAASGHTIAVGKRAFYRQIELSEDEAYATASETMCVNAVDDDAREGMAAFLDKRPPRWRAR